MKAKFLNLLRYLALTNLFIVPLIGVAQQGKLSTVSTRDSDSLREKTNFLRTFRTLTIDSAKFLFQKNSLIEVSTSLSVVNLTFNPSPSEVPVEQARGNVEIAQTRIHLNGQNISMLAREIKGTELTNMKNYISALGACQAGYTDNMPVVRVLYGQDANGLFLYYQPLLLCSNTPTIALPFGVGREFKLYKSGSYYYYRDDQFKKVQTTAEIDSMNLRTAQYKKDPQYGVPYGVEVQDNAGQWNPFDDRLDTDIRGSAKSIVFPIDQLIGLAKKGGINGSVKLWNVLCTVTHYYNPYDSEVFREYVKHELLPSTQDVTVNNTKLTVLATSKFSNMSHICPPRCDTFTFYIK